ncbi:MAG: hypothetical protein CMJ18_22070 [Phycisphaeraceae bacterium]|nr:hypothetical protein [Phycisphaeraceae bacterium]
MKVETTKPDRFAEAGRAGRPITDCLMIDAHAHIGPPPGLPPIGTTAETLIRQMDRLGIDRAAVSALGAVFSLAARQGNDQLLEALRTWPDRLIGYMAVNVSDRDDILPELQRCFDAGLRAVKIWSYGAREGLPYDHAHYDLVYGFADEHHLPILAHTWGAELDELEASFQSCRNIRWLLAHTGAQDLPKYIRAANEHEHVYLETCFSQCPRGLFETLVEAVPLHKIVWGSDQLFMSAAHQIGRVLFADIAPDQKRAILGKNAAALFDH